MFFPGQASGQTSGINSRRFDAFLLHEMASYTLSLGFFCEQPGPDRRLTLRLGAPLALMFADDCALKLGGATSVEKVRTDIAKNRMGKIHLEHLRAGVEYRSNLLQSDQSSESQC
jgi:hypothetical protein